MSKIQSINFQNKSQNNIWNNKTFANFKVPNIINSEIKTDNSKLKTNEKTKIALGAFVCAIIPVIIMNSFKKGNISKITESIQNKSPIKDKFEAVWSLFEIENYSQILATTTGGLTGGLLCGLKYDKNKENKTAKYKEGVFEFLNNMIPTTLVAIGLNGLKRIGKEKSIQMQAGVILSSVVLGMFSANKTSNIINEKIFDKNKKEKTIRNFKPADCLVHFDDLINLAVLAKIPFANRLQIDKLLPIIYARTGFEVGIANKNEQ